MRKRRPGRAEGHGAAPAPEVPLVPCTALLAVAFAGMAALTWQKWVDPFVDFGQLMEASREIAGGMIPFRDVALLHGPLSAGVLALLFRLFGATIATVTTFDLAVVAGLSALLFRLLSDAFGRLAATAGGLLFLFVFAFGQYTPASICNYVVPYTPEIVHGLVFGLLAVHFASRVGRTRRPADALLLGLWTGLCFLTKAEPFVAALGAAGTGLLLAVRARGQAGGRAIGVTGPFFAGLAAPPVAAFLLFLRWLPARDALRAALGPWPYVFSGEVVEVPFFRWVAGTDDAAGNFGTLILWTAVLAALFGGAAWWARRIPPGRSAAAFYAAAGLLVAALAATLSSPLWLEVSRPLPLLLGAALLVELGRTRREEESPGSRPFVGIPLAVFGLLLLLKTQLAARLYHYGQFLSMPGFILVAALLVAVIPAEIDRRGGSGRPFRFLAHALLALLCTTAVLRTRAFMETRTCTVAAAANRFVADGRGCVLEEVRAALAAAARPGQTLAVLPEGSLLNFLTGLSRPTPFGTLMPIEARLYGEGAILAAFERRPPDWVVLVQKDTSEFGPRFFGRDYLASLGAFVAEGYEPVSRWGDEPFTDGGFGAKLLRRKN